MSHSRSTSAWSSCTARLPRRRDAADTHRRFVTAALGVDQAAGSWRFALQFYVGRSGTHAKPKAERLSPEQSALKLPQLVGEAHVRLSGNRGKDQGCTAGRSGSWPAVTMSGHAFKASMFGVQPSYEVTSRLGRLSL